MVHIPSSAHWRDSARQPHFFGIDARVSLLVFLFILHIRWWTFTITALGLIFFIILKYIGFSLNIFLRWLRSQLAGPRKIAIPWWKQ